MASIVLVTKQCYLLCESINYISVHEMNDEEKENVFYDRPRKRRGRKKLTAKQKLMEKLRKAAQLYAITIDFIPVPNNTNASPSNSRRDGTSSVTISVRGYERAVELYRDMIAQIREQMPDKLFLDKMVEKFFADNPLEDK